MTEAVSLERISTERKPAEPMSVAEFEAAIRAVGAERYHDKHPFHHMLHGGKLNEAAGAGVGAQPLLLPGGSAAQGRRPHQPRCTTASCAANGCTACSTMTATATRKAASSAGWS